MDLPTISFEFFPPKTPEGTETLMTTAAHLERLSPDFFSVTFGAGGSTREGTINTIKKLQEKTSISCAPHLSCVGSTRAELIETLHTYKKMNVKRIVALRGDLPSGMGHSGELKFANELVTLIRETTNDFFQIEVAAYPECHPQSENSLDDILHFKKKIDAGANSAITQYFFNPDAYFYFVDACLKQNISIPIVPGIMPITQYTRLVRFSEMCGAEIPRWMRKRFESVNDDQESIKELGTEIVYDLCKKLLAGGAPGLHFYTLNHDEASVIVLEMLGIKGTQVR